MPAEPLQEQAPGFLRTALTPRMLVLLVVLLAAAAVCGRLGAWQLDRAELRGQASAEERVAALRDQPPERLQDVLAPQSAFPGDLVGRTVVARGTFEDDELLVPGRTLEGREGLLVLTPLRLEDAGPDGSRAVLAVVRGWVPSVEAAQSLDAAPAGVVEVTGYLQAGEAAGSGDVPLGQVEGISPGELVNRWGGPIYSAYVVATGTDPAQDPALAQLPPPSAPGGGLNVQNLAYALQWWVFAGFAILLWLRMVRDEARALAEEDADDAVDGGRRTDTAAPAQPEAGEPEPLGPGGALTPARRAEDADAAP